MRNLESGPSPEEMGLSDQETSTEKKVGIVYETDRVTVPNNLVEQGYLPGEASVKIRQEGDKFIVQADAKFPNHGTALDLSPTSAKFDDLDMAKKYADEMIEDIGNWSTDKYN